jgi:glycosyltransferase involved in cell wall biosynthesis
MGSKLEQRECALNLSFARRRVQPGDANAERSSNDHMGAASPARQRQDVALRIHQVIADVLPVHGGPSVSVPALCEALAGLGHEVTLHTLGPERLANEASSYRLQTYRRSRHFFKLGLSVEMPAGLRRAAHSGEVMHTHGVWMLPNIAPAWAVRGSACTLVAAPRGMLEPWSLAHKRWPKRLLWFTAQRAAISCAELLHVTAESELQAVRALGLGAPAALVPNGVAVPAEAEIAHFEGPRQLLFLSRLHPKKGLDRLLQAWLRVQREFPDWSLQLVGPSDAAYLSELRALVASSAAERVVFVGPAYDAEKRAAYQRAQLFILPSHSENFGQSIAEALAHGVPAIASRGTPWSGLERERCGYWVDNDVDSLAARLRQALSQPTAALRAMGARGRAWMQRDFSWQARARELADAYVWTRDGGPPPATIALRPA